MTSPEISTRPLAYSVRDAAAAISLSERTLRELIRKEEVETARIGGRVLVPHAALERLLERSKPDTHEPTAPQPGHSAEDAE